MVPESWVGKRVWLYNGQRNGRWMGTAAEYIALNVDLVHRTAAHVSFAEGATLGVPGMTAHYCVFVAGPVQGRTLLVTGAAGAVGHYAVQLAKWAGATVIGTVSSDAKAERARAGGADPVINYRSEDVAAGSARLPAAQAWIMWWMSISAAISRRRWAACAPTAASRSTRRTAIARLACRSAN